MKIDRLELRNFRAMHQAELKMDGKSSVIFGINGTGKSSVLKAVNLLYANIINQIVNRKELKQNYVLQLEDIQYGKSETYIAADFQLDNELVRYFRKMTRKTGKRMQNINGLKRITEQFQEQYISDDFQKNIPVFVNYGTNRLVLDIPLRIRTHHDFDIYSAFEKAIENRIDFRTFFEWYRNQEDFENQCKIEYGDLNYTDKALAAVRTSIMAMLDGCSQFAGGQKAPAGDEGR